MSSTGELLLDINNEDFDFLTQYAVLQGSLNSIAEDRMNNYKTKINGWIKLINDNQQILNMNLSSADRYQTSQYVSQLQAQVKVYSDNIEALTQLSMTDVLKTHSIFLNYVYKPFISCGIEYIASQFSNNISFNNSFKISIPIYGDFVSEPVISLKLSGFSSIDPVNKVKYCEYLGHRLFKQIDFYNEGLSKDSITTEDLNIYYNCELPKDKQRAWDACVGQEIPLEAYFNQDPTNNEYREKKYICYGPQTPKFSQDDITIYVPLLFWFYENNKALPVNSMSKDLTLFNFVLNDVSNICACLDYNNTGGEYNIPTISNITLYTKHIFVTDDILNLFKDKEIKTLIRLHQTFSSTLTIPNGSVSLNSLSYPLKALFIVARPKLNENGSDRLYTWNKNKLLTSHQIVYPAIFTNNTLQLGANYASFYTEQDVLSNLALSTKGIKIFYDQNNNIKFFSNCLSMTTSINNNNTFILNFSNTLTENTGFLNSTNLPGLSIDYTSSNISIDNPVNIYISSYSINVATFSNGKIEYLY